MTERPLCLAVETELREAMRLFLDNNYTSAPVVDVDGKILGILTELDLVKGILRHHIEVNEHATILDHKDLLDKAMCIEENATVTVVIKALVTADAHRVVVIDKSQRVVGIISPKDVLKIVMGETTARPSLQDQIRDARANIEQLKKEVAYLARDREQYEKLFRDSPYMMHSVDGDGRIILANKKIHEVLGYSDGELIGKNMQALYPESMHQQATQGLNTIIENGFHGLTYTSMVSKHGDVVRVDLASGALRNVNGDFIATITISRLVDADALLRALHGVVKDMNKK
ncbi:MAG: CBS domain-containing protein [Bdellovibrionia bacterium]